MRTAGYRCQSAEDITKASPEFAKACQALNAGKLTAATAAATKARDTGVRDFKACLDLEEAAKAAGGDGPAKAKTLCEEANKAEDLKKALHTAKANAAAKKTDLPYQANMLPDELDCLLCDETGDPAPLEALLGRKLRPLDDALAAAVRAA